MSYPRNVVIIKSRNEFCHGFPVGTVVTLTTDDGDSTRFKVFSANGPDQDGRHIFQSIMAADFEELAVEPSQEQKDVAERVKYLYSVQMDDTHVMSTQDRDYARAVKASLGGKREGVTIMAYAPVKEIR